MFVTLLTVALPIAPLLLLIMGRSLVWQMAAVAAVYLILDLQTLLFYARKLSAEGWGLDPLFHLLLLLTTKFSVFALAAGAQQRWRRLFLPRITAALFWICVATIPISTLLSIPLMTSREETSSFTGTPISSFAMTLYQFVMPIANLAFYGLAFVLTTGLLLLIPGLLRWIRHAL